MSKKELLAQFCAELEGQIATVRHALNDSIDNATGQETRSEGKYDTRATEAAYLADAQKKQLHASHEALTLLKNFRPPDFSADDSISLGALVEVDSSDGLQFYFLAPAGGGLSGDHLGCPVTLITPASPLFQALLDQHLGDEMESHGLSVTNVE